MINLVGKQHLQEFERLARVAKLADNSGLDSNVYSDSVRMSLSDDTQLTAEFRQDKVTVTTSTKVKERTLAPSSKPDGSAYTEIEDVVNTAYVGTDSTLLVRHRESHSSRYTDSATQKSDFSRQDQNYLILVDRMTGVITEIVQEGASSV
ncbi:MAG: hypothetical protein HYU64_09050 [Armatimonadetes bacterium]|nr:hypothetical protein [Armatimonadota bacterium]